MAAELVRTDRTGAVTTVTMTNPRQRNALSIDIIRALRDALAEVGGTDTLAVVLAAEGPVFSAGHDFRDMAGATTGSVTALFELCTSLMDTVQAMPQPVIARVHALATAAGCQLVATCDLAVAAETAGFALPGGRGGLFCHTPLVAVARNVGRKRALEMALSGDVVDAATALEWGLVNMVVPDDELDEAVAALVARVTRGSAAQRAAGKRLFYAQVGRDQAEAYALAIAAMADGAVGADGQEGMAAFLEKRAPRFTSTPQG
ncbi:enoyl-CoA hydratase-related protein [Arsenicicoccus sp. oral taxon 190]|uniref:enoyl-CoA hydratase-related protein n=1 Tax=Arsenicicoccus sp. oral taxon 190 TaxID=1658671 RepID=UPI000679EC46|nr:enoyl-CoA hydratase-related protein [Arsenicicoccus sp. oral taxon 190]AKT50174.1 enoyl-CoA hydratase [Arsenicicoccus sp. oral taxon 190]